MKITMNDLTDHSRHNVVERLRKRLPVGTRIVLVQMDDLQAPPVETKGTVKGVDDVANILTAWDNGCGLNLVYGVDRYALLPEGGDKDE